MTPYRAKKPQQPSKQTVDQNTKQQNQNNRVKAKKYVTDTSG